MIKIIKWAINTGLSWFTGSNLDRVFDTIDHRVDNVTKRDEIKADLVKTSVNNQGHLLRERTWWFQLFFVIPLGVWFSSVVIYSILFCQDCVYPKEWSIAALPPPLDDWAGIIILALFAVEGFSRIKR